MNVSLRLFSLGLVSLTLTAGALASPILYLFTGTASGTVGNTSFTGADLTISVLANTTNITGGLPGQYFQNVGAGVAGISISGVGAGNFTDVADVFVYQPSMAVGFGTGSIQADRDDLIGYSAFSHYDLSTAIGPVGGGSDFSSALGQFNNVGTSLGLLTVTALDNNYFTATTAVPEPASLSLLGFSVLGLALRRRKR